VLNKAKTPWLFSPCMTVLVLAMRNNEDDHLDRLARAFGQRVRDRRNQLDLTQEAASVATGISVTTYQKIENGHRMPRLENLLKLVRGLQVEPNELLGDLEALLPLSAETHLPGRRRRSRR
jgi:transcriptional regulator with XRE-family HTH domain